MLSRTRDTFMFQSSHRNDLLHAVDLRVPIVFVFCFFVFNLPKMSRDAELLRFGCFEKLLR